METLMLLQPIADSVYCWGCGIVVFGGLIWLSLWCIMRFAFSAGMEEIVEPNQYAKWYADQRNISMKRAIHDLAVMRSLKVFTRNAQRAFILGVILTALGLVPANAKDIFRNQIVYGAVTSSTTEHAISTLDKLLDHIDAKLKEAQND